MRLCIKEMTVSFLFQCKISQDKPKLNGQEWTGEWYYKWKITLFLPKWNYWANSIFLRFLLSEFNRNVITDGAENLVQNVNQCKVLELVLIDDSEHKWNY